MTTHVAAYENPLPARFVQSAYEKLGSNAASWLVGIPGIIRQCAQKWACRFSVHFDTLSINYVAPGTCIDGGAVVVKICIPGPEYATEADCLTEYDGDGALRLLARDDENNVLLLERLLPGETLTKYPDADGALHIATGLMKRLWRPAHHPELYPTVDLWIQHMAERSPGVLGAGHAFPKNWIKYALSMYAELVTTPAELFLLHGDLHMDNILSAERDPWLAIDPKGVIGPAIWETGPLILNALPTGSDHASQCKAIQRIVSQLAAELCIEAELIAKWGLVRAVLSGWWTVEDNGTDWEDSITLAAILNDMIK